MLVLKYDVTDALFPHGAAEVIKFSINATH